MVYNCSQRVLVFSTFILASLFLLSSCELWPTKPSLEETQINKNVHKGLLISETLKPITINKTKVAAADLTNLRNAYAELVPQIKNQKQKLQITKRLASLEMFLAEQQQEQGEISDKGYYTQAIEAYRSLQQQSAQLPENALGLEGEHIAYQLSRALELQGDTQGSFDALQNLIEKYPKSKYIAEAHFRQGEYLFARSLFKQASSAYTQAIQYPTSDYFAISAYMLGWSEFKLERYFPAVQAFGQVLDKYLGSYAWAKGTLPFTPELKTGEQRLVKDSLRIMSLVFSYNTASTFDDHSLSAYIDKVGPRHYDHQLFDSLAQLQLNNDRYKDSAKVYLAFAERYPAHPKAPGFYVKHIDAFILGKFPSLVMPAKRGFVEMFGVNGEIWPNNYIEEQAAVKPFLRQYLDELSQYEHARAQLLVKSSESNIPQSNKPQSNTNKKHIAAFTLAARWYQEYIDTFTGEVEAVEKRFLLAESLFDAGQKLAAITEFERYAYGTPQGTKAPEAGYAAILSYRSALTDLAKSGTEVETTNELQEAWLTSQLRFIETFPADQRANDIGLTLMQSRFENSQFERAINVADWLLTRQVNQQMTLSASLVAAHSWFALEKFADAESAYLSVLSQLTVNDARYADMQERLGVSIYKQGELILAETKELTPEFAQKEHNQVISKWLQIVTQLPDTKVRLNAHYDVTTLLLKQKQWSQAIELMQGFAERFPEDKLTANIPEKLIFAYEQNQQWVPAADGLYKLWQQQPDTENGRLSLWTAAEYYKKADVREQYLPAFRQYAHRYPQPFDTAMEARFMMSEFYLESNESSKRRFWLNKMIQANKAAADTQTIRSQYLAAMSSLVFAHDAGYIFDKIKLTLPLKTSLTKKRQAMDKALTQYDQVMAYGVAEFSTTANFKIAEIFRSLSNDLMESQRPKGLSALELEQYDMLLEEQAYPFEEQAIELHESNVQRSWKGNYDSWVQNSIEKLSELLPVRYGKVEQVEELKDDLY
ncbi:tetratricopeptide repeat protein [Paraglaciecola sp.]|uniref:tetratricopeptide repeat protein n=1 Tax=Paraglaciecola sp. TaxID=1920173 RepID=UPI003EF17E86